MRARVCVHPQLVALLKSRWGEVPFALDGLAGVPFAGKAGLGAYAHHVPDEGKLLITFAPHVGVGIGGKVGAIERDGQVSVSSACGAAVGALKTLSKADAKAPDMCARRGRMAFERPVPVAVGGAGRHVVVVSWGRL